MSDLRLIQQLNKARQQFDKSDWRRLALEVAIAALYSKHINDPDWPINDKPVRNKFD